MAAHVDVVDLAGTVREHGKEIENLVGWQKSQNGAIHRVEGKVDRLIMWMMTAAAVQLLGLIVALILFLLKGRMG
jgi:hypothetical protein